MSGEMLSLLAELAVWWFGIVLGYVVVLFGADVFLARIDRRRQARDRQREALQCIATEQAAAVKRVGTAFVVAQQQIRREAEADRGDRR